MEAGIPCFESAVNISFSANLKDDTEAAFGLHCFE
jgi:hypothetical protein